jgi:phosphopantetheinyl transferase (holo-ACP synthase)
VGNDIIDLTTRHAREKISDTRFIERVLTATEQCLLECHNETAVLLLWSFWAAKETGYKVIRKQYGNVTSAPRRYDVRLDRVPDITEHHTQVVGGVVETPHSPVFITITARHDFIHCIGISGEASFLDMVITGIGTADDKPSPRADSKTARDLARHHLSLFLNHDLSAIDIIRTKDIRGLAPPEVLIAKKRSTIDLSLSHDGNFAAYAFFQRDHGGGNEPQAAHHAGQG